MSKQILGIFTDLDEAIAACKKYTDTTGLYSRVVMQIVKGGSRSYVAYGYDEACRLNGYVPDITHTGLRILASAYLNATKLRVLLDAMARHPSAPPIVVEMEKEAMTEKKRITERVKDLISRHPIYRWCDIISAGRGGSLGESSALLFLGFIDPHEATTSGKAKKYWGFTPEGKLRSGAKSSFKPRLKGVGYFTAERIVMGRDSYYRPLFDAKKEYYTSKGVTGAHRKAIYWLAALLVSHAQQIMREAEGYEVPHHRMHIPPKSRPDRTPDEQILEALRNGKVLG